MNGHSSESTRDGSDDQPVAHVLDAPSAVPSAHQDSASTPASVAGDRLQPAATEGGEEAEIEQLEKLLAARSRELQDQRAETARVRGLLRDAVERFERSVVVAADPLVAETRRERDQAVARALEAEAARADIRFRLDEVMGHLAAAGAAEGALPGERIDVTCARLAGTVRGLVSALAETQEGREVAQARLMLAEQDVAELRADSRALERELAEAREQLELAHMKSRRLTDRFQGGLEGPSAAALRGELHGTRARALEAESAATAAVSRIDELKQELASQSQSRSEVEGARAAGAAARLVLEEELARARDDLGSARSALQRGEADREQATQALTRQLDVARARGTDQLARAEGHAEALREVRQQWGELAGALKAVLQSTATLSGFERDASDDEPTQPGVPPPIETLEGLHFQLAASERRAHRVESRLATAVAALRAFEASGESGAAVELAALRAILERD